MEQTLENENITNKNEENSTEEGAFFYIMTLQTDSGKKHQIKIYENSNASELAFNFCKDYNLDFPTMKYLKKSIKQIIQQFQNKKMNEMIYLFKDNNSIQEVAEEEVITDNSLKKSGISKMNNNSQNKKTKLTIEEEEKNSKPSISKENKEVNENIKETSDDDNNVMNNSGENKNKNFLNIKEEKKENDEINKNNNNNSNKEGNNQKIDEKNKLKEINSKEKNNEINEFEVLKSYNTLEDDEHIEHKDFSIDYCLDNDSVQIFSPTEQTTKIEQRSSIKNSSSLTKNKNAKYPQEKKNNSKINKSQINNNTNSSNKPIVRQSFLFNYQKLKNKKNGITKNEFIKRKFLTKKNSFNNKIIKKNHPSLEKMKIRKKSKSKNKSPVLELNHFNKKNEAAKQTKQHKYKSKYEKFLISMNDMRNRFFSNYYNYFIKSRNIYSTLNRNNITQKFHTNNSLNQDSNKSKSLSHNKNKKNKAQKSLSRKNESKRKKEKSMIEMNTLNYQKLNNSSKINLNTILKKEFHKQQTVFKNRTKSKYNITYQNNNNLFSKTINKRSYSFKRKKVYRKELFLEIKRSIPNSNGIKKMVATSLINIHKIKNPKEKKRNSLLSSRILKGYQIKTKIHKNRELFNKLFRCESTLEKKNKINKMYDKLHFELKNTNNNSINNLNPKTKRNNTDANYIQNKNSIKTHHKGRLMTYHKLN